MIGERGCFVKGGQSVVDQEACFYLFMLLNAWYER